MYCKLVHIFRREYISRSSLIGLLFFFSLVRYDYTLHKPHKHGHINSAIHANICNNPCLVYV